MKNRRKILTMIIGSFIAGASVSYTYANDNASVKVCFTPGEPCTDKIVDEISNAKSEILLQAYSFTSDPISNALIRAHKKGIIVKCIFDNSQKDSISPRKLRSYGITVFIDKPAGIAHNKVMIIDKESVVTGSFNFTKAAQHRNVENSIVIRDEKIAKQYHRKWHEKKELSTKM